MIEKKTVSGRTETLEEEVARLRREKQSLVKGIKKLRKKLRETEKINECYVFNINAMNEHFDELNSEIAELVIANSNLKGRLDTYIELFGDINSTKAEQA